MTGAMNELPPQEVQIEYRAREGMNPATAMMFGNLKFDGPKLEAMSVMGPFQAFMTLASKVPA